MRPIERFPVILEMIPYGKDNWRLNSDTARGEWLAARGFAFCRLDVRGTGSSPGVAEDEYTEAETLDGYDAVEWLAAQPWCTGAVGMWGISYGGFTSIQVAKLRPPHLRAILPMYATDDRYRDDVHIRGGCVTASEKSQYSVSQLGMNAMPPRPAFRGEGWRDEWRERLERTPPWLMAWIREQTDGPYWRRGSLAPEYEALDCAVFQIAGWSDSYVDPAFRIQERSRNVPVRTLVGNWVHDFPDSAYPGPNLDWLHELVRFFDRYLKGIENGWEDEPALVWFERGYADPEPFPREWPGRWRAAAAFPVPGTGRVVLHLGDARLEATPAAADGVAALPHRATTGTAGSMSWGAGSYPNGLARDLRPDEARGLTWTSAPLTDTIDVIGVPEAVLHVTASMPVATCVVRLSEVAPDGTSSHVATGALNLTHRLSDTDPAPMPTVAPGDGGGSRPAPYHGLPVHAGQPDPPHGPDRLVARPVAVTAPRRGPRAPRTRGAVTPGAAGAARGRADARRARVPDGAGRAARGRRGRGRRARCGRSPRTCSAGR